MRLPTAHFLRRRQTAILATFFGLLGGACALVLLLPVSYVARANLVSNGPGYDGSAELYAEQLDNERALAGLVDPELEVGILGELFIMPRSPERLRPPLRPLIDVEQSGGFARVTVNVRGLTESEALDAANELARRMIRADEGDVGQVVSADPLPSGDPALELAALRAAHPLLEDDARLTGYQEEEREWQRRREAEGALEVQLQHEEARVSELQVAVARQARDAFLAHEAELQREREREAAARAAEQQRLASAQAQRVAREEPRVPLSELERQLRLLLATRTRRHPEVRSLLRRIELERQRVAPTPSWTEDPGAARTPSQGNPAQRTPSQGRPAQPSPVQPSPAGSSLPGDPSAPAPSEPAAPAPSEPGAPGEPGGPGEPPPGGAELEPGPFEPEPGPDSGAEPISDEPISDEPISDEPISDEPISDEPPGGRERPSTLPAVWLQRAPSYPELLQARQRASATRARLASERTRTQRMRERLDRQGAELERASAGLAEARAEELRLVRALSRRDLRRAQQGARSPARLVRAPAEVVERHEPIRLLPLAILAALGASLLAAWVLDQRDPSLHEPSELESLGVPVLGVIPHLRRH